ncbi:MAG TPA: flagellar hook-associated protein FlgK, partial [Rhodospirillales bacterium]|nr:flagellar hook-associated protein FlgK [Rhodospirillales bacterium]
MSLELTLKDALSGLQTSQASLQSISNNIANANTEGYSRKQVSPKSLVIGGKGFGVSVGEVRRSVDEGILNLLRNETSETRKLEQQDTFLSQINKFFGRPEDNSSITHKIADFASQFDALAVSPEVEASQFLAVNSGADVLRNLESLSDEIQRLRNTANNDIDTTVTEFNLLVETIANINGQIVQFENSNLDGSELKDQRDRSLNSLAEIVDIKYFDDGTGAINVFAGTGQTVVNGGAGLKISYASPSLIVSRSEYTPKTATNYIGPGSSGHPVGGIPGIFVGEEAPNTDITTGISSGRLKGLVDIRDFELPMLQTQLDELAEKLKVEINAVHNKGAGAPAVFGFTGDRYVQAGTRFEGTGQVRIGIIDDDGVLQEDKIVDLSLPEGFTTYESSIFASATADAITTAGQLTFSNDAGAFALTVGYDDNDSLNDLVTKINAVTGGQNIVASVVTTDGTGLNRLKITDTDNQTFNITETGSGSLLTD